MDSFLEKISQRWFISEPALFRVMCLFTMVENRAIACPFRVGSWGRALTPGGVSTENSSRNKLYRSMEYNPELLGTLDEHQVAEYLKCEMIRVLLKHPYERRPDGCGLEACALGSNILLAENYMFHYVDMPHAVDYGLEKDRTYEWYCQRIQDMCCRLVQEDGNGGDGSHEVSAELPGKAALSDLSEEWREDPFMVESVNSIIRQCEESGHWGSLGGNLVECIKASARAKINWRAMLGGFRGSILSSRRRLTRMRPSRRFDFEQMGSTREFDTRLLVAMDVSGSIGKRVISYFLGVINSSFRYGIRQLDVIQFDVDVTKVMTTRQAIKFFSAVGRGGTSFQPAVDYAVENGYDGLVVLTDGYALEPILPPSASLKILWVCTDEHSYESNHRWMERTGRVCTIDKR